MGRRVVVAVVVVACVAALGWWYLARARHRALAIDEVAVTAPRVLTVTVSMGVPPCETDLRVTAEESAARVVLTARTRRESGTCPAVAVRRTAEVTLRDPLGDRAVVDGHRDRGLVVGGRP